MKTLLAVAAALTLTGCGPRQPPLKTQPVTLARIGGEVVCGSPEINQRVLDEAKELVEGRVFQVSDDPRADADFLDDLSLSMDSTQVTFTGLDASISKTFCSLPMKWNAPEAYREMRMEYSVQPSASGEDIVVELLGRDALVRDVLNVRQQYRAFVRRVAKMDERVIPSDEEREYAPKSDEEAVTQ